MRGRARLWSAAVAVGVAQAALDETIGYATERVVFGKPVAHHQGNAFDLAHAAARVHGARLIVRDAAAAFDDDEPDAGFWATQAWLETMDAAFVATNLGIQLLGGHGFIVDHLAEKRFREARMLAMLAGARDAAEADTAAFVLDVDDPLPARAGSAMIELDARTQEMLEEVRALGRTHIRPMGLEADRTADAAAGRSRVLSDLHPAGRHRRPLIGAGEERPDGARLEAGAQLPPRRGDGLLGSRRRAVAARARPRRPGPAQHGHARAARAVPRRSSPTTPRPAGARWR